eukprot:6415785-Lingulodinium_polyedra.AAC.1
MAHLCSGRPQGDLRHRACTRPPVGGGRRVPLRPGEMRGGRAHPLDWGSHPLPEARGVHRGRQ